MMSWNVPGLTFNVRTSILSLVFFFITIAFCSAEELVLPRETSESPTTGYVGKPVSVFETHSVADRPLSSSTTGAKVLIIDLWGLNCASCLDEMKMLESIYQKYRDHGLEIWAVNTEDIDGQQIEQGLRARGVDVSYDIIADPGLKITKLFTEWYIPVTVIIDSEGIVQYYKIGFKRSDAEKIEAKVGVLIAP